MKKLIVFIQLIIIAAFVRSNIYFISSSITILTLLIITSPFYAVTVINRKMNIYFFIAISAIFIHLIIESIYLFIYYYDIEQFKDFFYTLASLPIFILLYKAYDRYKVEFLKALETTIFYIYIILLIIVIIEAVFKIHLPGSRGNLADSITYSSKYKFIPTGTFFNSNDLAMHLLLYFPFLFVLNYFNGHKRKAYFIYIITLIMLILVMSRTAIFVIVIFPIFMAFINKRYTRVLVYIILVLCSVFLLKALDFKNIQNSNTLTLSYNRIINLLNIKEEIKEDDTSASSRLNVYFDTFKNFDKYILGKGFQSEEQIFNMDKKGTIHHAHSLFVEFIYNFGYIPSIPILFAFFYPLFHAIKRYRISKIYRFIIIQLLILYIGVHIPATSLRYISVWIILGLSYVLAIKPEILDKEIKKTIE